MKDIGDLRINEMEELLEGMNENAKEMEDMMNGKYKAKPITGEDAIKALLKMQ